jgi:GDPmannose 4,6-dehydratase
MIALICGISGQDGSYLAEFLLKKGYVVWGTSRDAQTNEFKNLKKLNIYDSVNNISMAPNDFRSVLSVISKIRPDEVYYLSGQTSVGLSFEQPVETLESIISGVINILESVMYINKSIKIYNASSSECFGDNQKEPCNELTSFRPKSPYGIAKASAHWLIDNYRQSYGIFACNGILFNHESPLRPERFVTQKIISTARRISNGSAEKLNLGKLDIVRDWGWAPDYVEAMWLMLQNNKPEDFVIATGEANSLESFVINVFENFDLDWKNHVVISSSLIRPNEFEWSQGDPTKAFKILGWQAKNKMSQVIDLMINESFL